MLDYELKQLIKSKINCPTYYKQYIDKSVDLTEERQVCSPFRKDESPSFTYNPQSDIWRDWPAKIGGDVIKLHMFNLNKMRGGTVQELRVTYDEALRDLARILGLDTLKFEIKPPPIEKADENKVRWASLWSRATGLVNCPEEYLELDQIMSERQSMRDMSTRMEDFINKLIMKRGGEPEYGCEIE